VVVVSQANREVSRMGYGYVIDGRKECGQCLEIKPVEDFNRHGLAPNGRQRYTSICMECRYPDRKEPRAKFSLVCHKTCRKCKRLFVSHSSKNGVICGDCPPLYLHNYRERRFPTGEQIGVCDCGNSFTFTVVVGKQGRHKSCCDDCITRTNAETKA
jgi:hypothetical protein